MSVVGMKCDACGNASKIKSTRESKYANCIYRRRECKSCKHRWSTIEVNEDFMKIISTAKTATEANTLPNA